MLEDVFFKAIDQGASDALDMVFSDRITEMSDTMVSNFIRLIVAFLHRTPDSVKALRARFSEEYGRLAEGMRQRHEAGEVLELPYGLDFEQTLAALKEKADNLYWGNVLEKIIGGGLVGNHILKMHWHVRKLEHTELTFLTSDKPVVHYNGISKAQGHIGLPLGPRLFFLATNNEATTRNILDVPDRFLVSRVNHEITKNAVAYVYGTDNSQAHFIDRRLKNPHPPPTPRPPTGYSWPMT